MVSRATLTLITIFLFIVTSMSAEIIYVPGDSPTIQDAVDTSNNGDTIYVEPGTYVENINFHGKEVLLKSIDGPEVTTIDGSNPDHPDSTSCVMFVSGEGRDAVVDGFTLTAGGGVSRGDWGFYGGGAYTFGTSPTIRNNIITGNMNNRTPEDTSGGGIYCFYGSPLIERNLICGQGVSYIGGGIGISFCDADIVNNTIVGNSAGWGGGISFWRYGSSTITNNIIAWNLGGGGIWCGAEVPDIRFNDVWNNLDGDYLSCDPGFGDISMDPLWIGGDPFDYHLEYNSPCIDAGDPESPQDPDGTRADMGAYYFHQEGVILVPEDFPTIQEAIDSSSDGNRIFVSAGTYVENVNFRGKEVLVRSIDGPEVTIIDGSDPDHPDSTSCVMFVSGEGRDAILEGFTITNGGGVSWGAWGYYGGGVYSDEASPTIRNNIIYGNMSDAPRTPDDTSGGGIECRGGSPLIERNVIFGHNVSYIGGGISVHYSYAEIINNTIVGNSAGSGGGISFWAYTGTTIVNNIIASNTGGGGIWCGLEDPGLGYNDVWDNEGGDYWGCSPGPGDISEDPLFLGGEPFDYHLQYFSPCIDAGDPESPPDPDGTRADMGAYYYHQGAHPPIEITVVPDGSVFQVGKRMGFTVDVENNTDELISFQGWTEGETPWGDLYSPLLGPIDALLGPYGSFSAHFTQKIPQNIVFGGPYIYRVKVGIYPDYIFDEGEFEFFVVP